MDKKAGPIIIVVLLLIVGVAVLLLNSAKREEPASPAKRGEPAPTTKAVILITKSGFDPKEISVPKGTEVTWINETTAEKNVSSADHPAHKTYPALNLGNIEAGKSVSLVFDTVGEYPYHNHLKPLETGVVKVVEE